MMQNEVYGGGGRDAGWKCFTHFISPSENNVNVYIRSNILQCPLALTYCCVFLKHDPRYPIFDFSLRNETMN